MSSRAVLGCVAAMALGALGGLLWTRWSHPLDGSADNAAALSAPSRVDHHQRLLREEAKVVARDSSISKSGTPKTEAMNKMAFSLEQPSSDFGGFVPSDKPLAASLWLSYHNCHTPGALCGHESYIDLIPQIMGDSDHGPDSWAGSMEEQLKAHFDASTSPLKVEQIHCGNSGCLIDLTQDKGDRDFLQGTALYKEAREALTAEPWFKEEFFATYGESPFTGFAQHWGGDSDKKFEELWIFAKKTQ